MKNIIAIKSNNFLFQTIIKNLGLLILGTYIFLPNDILKIGKLKIMFPIFFLCFWLNHKNKMVYIKNIFRNFRGGIIAISCFCHCFILCL